MFKKITSLLLTVVMILGLISVVGGEETADSRVIFDLKSFGIIDKDIIDDEFLSESMTRAEFVATALKMLQYENVLSSMKSAEKFTDVNDDTPYSDYIYAGVTLGILNGYGDGTFRVNDYITADAVCKVLVCILGYASVAVEGGGYPSGYTATAARIGLLRNTSFSNPPTREEIYRVIYNALDIDMMEKQLVSNQAQYAVVRGKTFREQYKTNDLTGNVIKGKGIINADYDFYINDPVGNIKPNQIQIDEKLYYIGTTEPSAYLGLEVDFYYIDDTTLGTQTLISVKPTINNDVLELTEEEFERFSDGNVYYYATTSSDREKTAKLSKNLKLIKNGVPQKSWSDKDIAVESGILKLIDNTGDGAYNLVIREEYSYVVVKEVKADRILFKDNQTFNSMPRIFFEFDDMYLKYIFLNGKGERISYENIKADDILSVMVNEFSTLYKIIVTDEIIEGEITEFSSGDKETKVIINAEEYPIYKNVWRTAKIGDTVCAWLNFKGKIIDFEPLETGLKYGYAVWAGAVTQGTDGKAYSAAKGLSEHKIRMIIPGSLAIEYDIDDTNPDNIIKTPYIKGKNSDIKDIKVADSLKKGVLMQTPIKYRLNGQGEINYFEEAKSIGAEGKRVYNGYDRTFGAKNIGAFGTDDTTKILCVPTNSSASEDDYYAMIDMNNNSEYFINGYDIDENSLVKLAVIHDNMEVSSSKGITKNSKLSVAASVKNIYNQDTDEAEINMVFYSDGARKTYKIADNISDYVAANVKSGDVFYYALNALGELSVIRVMGHFSQKPGMYNIGNSNDEMSDTATGKLLFGQISDVGYKKLIDASNKYLDITKIGFGIGELEFTLETEYRNPPRIYKVNMNKKTVEIGSREDIYASSPGSESYIFTHITGGRVRGIVIYKY